MKALYWRPQKVSRLLLILIAVVSLLGGYSVEIFRVKKKQSFFKEKMDAVNLAKKAFDVLKSTRLEKMDLPISPEVDPARSGLIGALMTPVTSNTGSLSAKQTSVNPNFAAVILHDLKRIDVRAGDMVAVNFTGSFPALNVCVLAALEIMKVKPLVISSVSASQWGANEENFLWVDMERILLEEKIFSTRSLAFSLGGIEDRALGIPKKGVKILRKKIEESGVPFLEVVNYGESVEKRIQIYQEASAGNPIKAFINVGGGTSSVGKKFGKGLFRSGLNMKPPPGITETDSVMARLVMGGIPVIHLVGIERLAQTYGLALTPSFTPKAGEGTVFYREEYNRQLATAILLTLSALIFAFIRTEWGFRIFQTGSRSAKGGSSWN